MPLMTWRLGDWLGVCKTGIRHRRRPLSRRMAAERLEPRALLAGTATVSGLTFIDANSDGDQDAVEIAVRGIAVTLSTADNSFNETVTTDADGSFSFFRVPAGTYTLPAQPGTQMTGSAVPVEIEVVDDTDVPKDIALGGLKPTVLSLRQFLNTSTIESTIKTFFAAAGNGRSGNEVPTVLGAADLDVSFTTSAEPTTQNIDLAGIFTDQNFENSEVQFQTSAGNINVELFDKDTPITVANFYEYANSGRYNDTFFHRLVDGFVLQGGGFAFDDTTDTFPEVTEDPTIQNEFNTTRSNLASTIAMAKLGGDPNSASSQFFFNLGDNSDNLDTQNGGFTVFGKIAGATSTTAVTDSVLLDLVDVAPPTETTISNQSSANSAFSALPLNDYSGTSFPTDATPENFLRILGIDTVRRKEALSYTVVSITSTAPSTAPPPVTAAIVNHRLQITSVANASGQADIVVRATDLSGEFVTTTFQVTVVNDPPTATVAITPTDPTSVSVLTATATTSDVNGQSVSLSYVWKVGSNTVKTISATTNLTDTLDLTNMTVNVDDIVTVEVTPNDGTIDGLTVTDSVTINVTVV